MTKCSVSGEEFISFVFSPRVGVLTGIDVEKICLKDNLTFVELLRPFSQLYKDVNLRDGNNLLHPVCNLRINFVDASTPPPLAHAARGHLREAVSICALDQNITSSTYHSGKVCAQVPNSTPWFEAWRHTFVKSLWPSSHEFLGHNLACIFVLSTSHPNPVQGFKELTQRQVEQQHNHPGSHPLWFSSDVIKFYILVHDPSKPQQNGAIRAEDLYAQVCAAFGSASCCLLPLFTTEASLRTGEPDFSLPNGGIVQSSGHQTEDPHNHGNPTCNDSGTCGRQIDKNNQALESPDPWLSHVLPHGYYCTIPPENVNELSAPQQRHIAVRNPLADDCTDSGLKQDEPATGNVQNGDSNYQLIQTRHRRLHGRRLSQTDRDRIRAFVHEFVVRSLLPWVEKTMRSLNDQVAHRLRITRSIFSATKKLFYSAVGGGGTAPSLSSTASSTGVAQSPLSQPLGSAPRSASPSGLLPPTNPSKSSVPTASLSAGLIGRVPPSGGGARAVPTVVVQPASHVKTAGVFYAVEAPELQMRRLADLAFLFQQYELAHQTYMVLKKDFQNDSAWLHCAGAQEMAAFSMYLQGSTSQRQYPHHYVDAAVSIYLQTCQSPELALRATLLNTEALCSRGLYAEAATCLLRLALEEDDLTSGVLIEQAAHCVLHLHRPFLRKFAFQIALAAHRYSRAKQPHLTIRCYKVAQQVFRGRGWSLIEDHINYNTGRQAFLTQDLAVSVSALRQTLSANSRQSEDRQNLLLREYLLVLKAYLSSCQPTHGLAQGMLPYYSGYLPEFPLPVINFDQVKVMLGRPTRQRDDLGIEARGLHFSDDEDAHCDDTDLDTDGDYDLNTGEGTGEPWSRAFSFPIAIFPEWMEGTDLSDDADSPGGAHDAEGNLSTADRQENRVSNPVLPENSVDTGCRARRYTSAASLATISNGRSARRLERLLLLSSSSLSQSESADGGRRKPAGKRLLLLATKRTARQKRPVAPCWEHLTMQLPLVNPMRIPLVLTNLHLLWTLRPSPDSSAGGSLSSTISNDWATYAADALEAVGSGKPEELEAMAAQCRQAVSTEIVTEFIMLPDEEKTVELGLFPRQPGQLEITAVAFDWDHRLPTSSVAGSTGDSGNAVGGSPSTTRVCNNHQSSLDAATAPPSLAKTQRDDSKVGFNAAWTPVADATSLGASTERCSVLGKVPLTTSALSSHGQDSRLSWTVTRPAPLLDVVFSTFPTRLLQGQLHRLQLTLANVSHFEALHSIRMASTWPGLVAFEAPASLVPDHGETHVSGINRFRVACKPATAVLDVPLPAVTGSQAGQLEAGSKAVVPMWLRAPHLMDTRQKYARRLGQSVGLLRRKAVGEEDKATGSSRQKTSGLLRVASGTATSPGLPLMWEQRAISLVFAYRSVKANLQQPVLNCRFVRHHTNVDLHPSVQLEAIASRCLSPTCNEEVGNVLISLRLRNVSVSPLRANFSILQVTCASRYWALTPATMGDTANKPIQISPGEVASLYLNVSSTPDRHGAGATGSEMATGHLFSSIALPVVGSDQAGAGHVAAHQSPFFDFYSKSGTQWHRQTDESTHRQIHEKPAKDFCRNQVGMDITLIIFWKALPEGSTCQQVTAGALGQSHVTIRQLDRHVCMPPKNDSALLRSTIYPQLPTASIAPPPLSRDRIHAAEHQLVHLRFSHPSVVIHEFPSSTSTVLPACARSPLALHPVTSQAAALANVLKQTAVAVNATSLATIPLQLELFNPTCSPLAVLLKTNDFLHSHEIDDDSGTREPLLQLQWIGFTNRRLRLPPGGLTRLSGLRMVAPRPGVYDVSRSLVVLAKPIDDAKDGRAVKMLPQFCVTPSMVLVEMASGRELTSSFIPMAPKPI